MFFKLILGNRGIDKIILGNKATRMILVLGGGGGVGAGRQFIPGEQGINGILKGTWGTVLPSPLRVSAF